jgi:probable poly-beta-1,6-N-acetyl-D-glucosamine export protein
MAKKQIQEIYWIRALACLSVVMIHAITRTTVVYDLPEATITFFRTIQMMIMFATPMFVMISEVILANAYPTNLPKKFFYSRFSYIFLPYLLVPVLYVIFFALLRGYDLSQMFAAYQRYILDAKWHGYFIIIIFQFFILHALYITVFKKVPAWIMLTVTFAINVYYLYKVNFDPFSLPEGLYNNARLPFWGWIFYFTVAFYFGKNIDVMKKHFKKGFIISFIASIAGLSTVLYLYLTEVLVVVSSLRLDIMFYTIPLFFALFYLFSKIPTVPRAVLLINKYAFAIYLLHMLVIEMINLVLPKMNIGLYTILVFGVGVLGSIFMAFLLSKVPFSQFVIGKIRSMPSLQQGKVKSKAA